MKGLNNPVAIAAAGAAANKAGKAVKDINSKTNNALAWIAAIAAGGGLIFFLAQLNKLNRLQNAVGDTVGGAIDNIGGGIDSGAGSGTISGTNLPKPTINEQQAQSRAAILFKSMDRIGTDFNKIKEALTGINTADYLLIFQKFGEVRYAFGGQSIWPAPLKNLNQWLAEELTESEINELRKLLPKIF